MPPAKKRQRVECDLSWVNTSVTRPEDILPSHRLRAAGLHMSLPCPLPDICSGCTATPEPEATTSDDGDKNASSSASGSGRGVIDMTVARGSSPTDIITPPPLTLAPIFKSAGASGVKVGPMDKEKRRTQMLAKAGCTAQSCKNNPQCYNHIGLSYACSEQPKQIALDALGDGVGVREKDAPIGLRNLGATCYANAFLQVWYHNDHFRNELYKCHLTDNSNLSHLVTVFGFLQKYAGDIADPSALVEVLGLRKGEQQDAGEFSKLFLDAIRRELAQQPDPAARNLMSRLFEGKLQYRTACCECGHESVREESFLELELSLKDGDSLADRLNELQRPERLTGDNKYHCAGCDKKCDALRRVEISEVPEVVHFSLLRFTYDFNAQQRRKSKAMIRYPRSTRFGDVQYELQAVVTHLGTSPHSGHFVCDVLEQRSQDWIRCNDELIEPTPVPKKSGKNKEVHDGLDSSKDAYMLVYARRQPAITPIDPPAAVMEAVEASNTALQVSQAEWQEKRDQVIMEQDEIRGIKENVARVLPGTDCIVSGDTLRNWFKGGKEELAKPFLYDSISCEHSTEAAPLVDPDQGRSAKLISETAFALIASTTPIVKAQICPTCVEDKFKELVDAEDRQEQTRTFDDLNVGQKDIVVPQLWLDKWKKGNLEADHLPTSNGYSLYCAHDEPYLGNRPYSRVSAEALALLQSAVGDFPTFSAGDAQCAKCVDFDKAGRDMEETWREQVKLERKLFHSVDVGPIMFDTPYYAISPAWYDQWQRYRQSPMPRPPYTADICEHGGLPVDPRVEKLHHLRADGWALLQQIYGPQTPVTIQYAGNPLPDALTEVTSWDPAICEPCCRARALDWAETIIHIAGLKKKASSTRSRGRDIEITVTKETTIKELRVEIMKLTNISPLSQELMYGKKRLDKAEDTMHDVGMMKNGSIKVTEILEFEDQAQGAEGFHGTALMVSFGAGTMPAGDGEGGGHDGGSPSSANGRRGSSAPGTAANGSGVTSGDGGMDAAALAAIQVGCTACTFLNTAMDETCEMCGCAL